MNVKAQIIGVTVLVAASCFGAPAFARSGYPMNTPGYQTRLQESRGYITNRSGSLHPASPVRREYRYRRHLRR